MKRGEDLCESEVKKRIKGERRACCSSHQLTCDYGNGKGRVGKAGWIWLAGWRTRHGSTNKAELRGFLILTLIIIVFISSLRYFWILYARDFRAMHLHNDIPKIVLFYKINYFRHFFCTRLKRWNISTILWSMNWKWCLHLN